MANLTENEILDCLITNYREAAEHCGLLAKLPAQGPTYVKLRENLKLLEGCARQMLQWRMDARWLKVANECARCHQICGDWLRGHAPRKMFLLLETSMRKSQRHAEDLRDNKTGRRGAILPKVKEAPHRDTRPVYVRPSGLIVPSTVH